MLATSQWGGRYAKVTTSLPAGSLTSCTRSRALTATARVGPPSEETDACQPLSHATSRTTVTGVGARSRMVSELAALESTLMFGVGWCAPATTYSGVGGRLRTKRE